MLTLEEALQEAVLSKKVPKGPYIKLFISSIDKEHYNDAIKLGDSFLETLFDRTTISSGTAIKGYAYITPDTADEVIDMIERKTIAIAPIFNLSYNDFDELYDPGKTSKEENRTDQSKIKSLTRLIKNKNIKSND